MNDLSSSQIYLPGMTLVECRNFLTQTLQVPAFRAKQIQQWMYRSFVFDPMQMLNLPLALREQLAARCGTPRSCVAESAPGSGGTEKLLLRLEDGECIEMVLIPSPERMTFCLSTQVGCPVRCRFCASGQDGLIRNLRCDEILEEMFWGIQRNQQKLPDNLVFMGIGEGLLNWKELHRALECLTEPDGFGMSPRRITVSTSGYVPGMYEFAKYGKPFTLAISLHAVEDTTRALLIPDAVRYPIAEIMEAADHYALENNRMITLEYTLIAGINDKLEMAKALGRMARSHHAKVNLIACNAIGKEFRRPEESVIRRFAEAVEAESAHVTLRVEKGSSASSACGQLRATHKQPTEK